MPAGPVTVNGRPASSLLDRDPSEVLMTTTSSTPDLAAIGARPIHEFDGVHDVWPRGERLAAVRAAGEAFKPRFKQGRVKAVRSVDIAAAPYPVAFAFHGAVTVPHSPLISMINRMIVVQYDDFDGVARTLVFEPTVPAGLRAGAVLREPPAAHGHGCPAATGSRSSPCSSTTTSRRTSCGSSGWRRTTSTSARSTTCTSRTRG